MDRQRYLIPMLALITVWRLALLPTAELCPEEALALLLGKHHALWHIDMGPLMPWLVKFSTLIGGTSEIGVRWLAPVLAFALSVMLWRLVRGIYDPTTAAWSVVALQMVPAFNVMSLVMTSTIVSTTLVLAFLMLLRMALQRAEAWNKVWWLAGLALALAMLTDWRNGLAWVCAAVALGGSSRRRHHLLSPGFFIVTAMACVPLAMLITWNVQHDWPTLEAGEAEPTWQVWPNILRWLLLASPALVLAMLWSLRKAWRSRLKLSNDEAMVLTFALPFALLDFAWGPREAWPSMGFPLWLVLTLGLLAHQNIDLAVAIPRKVMMRSAILLFAAVQSLVLMRSDFVRQLGVPWAFNHHVSDTKHTYRRWFTADPASHLMGWKQGATIIDQMIAQTTKPDGAPWFLITRNWQLAAGFDAALSPTSRVFQPAPDHPRLHVIESTRREHPLAMLPRYDAMLDPATSYAKQNALYITDDAQPFTPPTAIVRAFDHWEILTVVRLMHAGAEVRTLKIFACYGYKPPDL